MNIRPNEVHEDISVWDINQYTYEEADCGNVVTIYSKDDFQDKPTNQYFRLTCHKGTYDRVMEAMEHAVRMEIEEPDRENGSVFTQIQFYDENNESECIVVGEIRLPHEVRLVNNALEISAMFEFIKRIEEQDK